MQPKHCDTAKQVMDALGGPTAVARLTGQTMHAVINGRKRGVFPSRVYLVMQAALAAKGFSAPASLWGMIEPKGDVA